MRPTSSSNQRDRGAQAPLSPIIDDSDKRFKGVPVLHRRYWVMCAIHCNAYVNMVVVMMVVIKSKKV